MAYRSSAHRAGFGNGGEMAFKSRPISLFDAALFTNAQNLSQEPASLSDSDWEDEGAAGYGGNDSGSEFEEDSPRGSFDSFGKHSGTTASSMEEATTPTSHKADFFNVQIRRQNSHSRRSTLGPRGPHLFRSSAESSRGSSFDYALQLSPVATKTSQLFQEPLPLKAANVRSTTQQMQAFARPPVHFSKVEPRNWSSDQVAAWLASKGLEEDVIAQFEGNDITGAILLNLQFENLKELGIPSFGKRHQVWSQLGSLRTEEAVSPAPTLFEDSSRPATQNSRPAHHRSNSTPPIGAGGGSRRGRIQRAHNPMDDAITPEESVSIVAIEQLMPRPHKCSKGENCSKFQRQQRMREQLGREGFAISPVGGGHILIAGNPASTDGSESVVASTVRPTSEAVPSVVASSDLLGSAAQAPNFSLQEHVQAIGRRDPQESVKQFLTFNHLKLSADVPPTPPLETPRFEPAAPLQLPFPPPLPHTKLTKLPKLAIPAAGEAPISDPESPCEDARPSVADLKRLGTPASEMDVPISRLSLGPVARDASQSVPPNMQFRKPVQQRPGSRESTSWRRPSMQRALPTLPEHGPLSHKREISMRNNTRHIYGNATTQAGYMKKRKNKLLRHEWQEHHFRLTGTVLNMHNTAKADDTSVLDTIDVDDYAVACSSLGSQSKIASALKTLRLKKEGSSSSMDDSSFVFQLVPAAERAKMLGLLKEGKTHHFAVTTRDERIDWMREVMLAKALKEKASSGENVACEVSINGHMVDNTSPNEL